jgi:hypothetical protein
MAKKGVGLLTGVGIMALLGGYGATQITTPVTRATVDEAEQPLIVDEARVQQDSIALQAAIDAEKTGYAPNKVKEFVGKAVSNYITPDAVKASELATGIPVPDVVARVVAGNVKGKVDAASKDGENAAKATDELAAALRKNTTQYGTDLNTYRNRYGRGLFKTDVQETAFKAHENKYQEFISGQRLTEPPESKTR